MYSTHKLKAVNTRLALLCITYTWAVTFCLSYALRPHKPTSTPKKRAIGEPQIRSCYKSARANRRRPINGAAGAKRRRPTAHGCRFASTRRHTRRFTRKSAPPPRDSCPSLPALMRRTCPTGRPRPRPTTHLRHRRVPFVRPLLRSQTPARWSLNTPYRTIRFSPSSPLILLLHTLNSFRHRPLLVPSGP